MNDGAGYAQGFYLLLYPFTLLAGILQKFYGFFEYYITFIYNNYLCKKFELTGIETFLIIFIIMYSIVVRVNLIMGQHTIFTLFFLILPFVYKSKLFTILSGISYLKYNIGYVLLILFFVSKEYKKVFLSLSPVIIGLLVFCLITNTNIVDNIFQPIQLAIFNAKYSEATLTNIFYLVFLKIFLYLMSM